MRKQNLTIRLAEPDRAFLDGFSNTYNTSVSKVVQTLVKLLKDSYQQQEDKHGS